MFQLHRPGTKTSKSQKKFKHHGQKTKPVRVRSCSAKGSWASVAGSRVKLPWDADLRSVLHFPPMLGVGEGKLSLDIDLKQTSPWSVWLNSDTLSAMNAIAFPKLKNCQRILNSLKMIWNTGIWVLVNLLPPSLSHSLKDHCECKIMSLVYPT